MKGMSERNEIPTSYTIMHVHQYDVCDAMHMWTMYATHARVHLHVHTNMHTHASRVLSTALGGGKLPPPNGSASPQNNN